MCIEEIEQQVLGVLLLYTNKFEELPILLQPDHFYKAEHQAIFREIDRSYHAGLEIDIFTIGAALSKAGVYENGVVALSLLTTNVHSSTHFHSHVMLLHEAWQKRQLQTLAATIESSKDGVEETLAKAEDMLYQIASAGVIHEPMLIHQDVEVAHQRMLQASQDGLPRTGLSSGFSRLDDYTLGFHPSDLIIIAARTSQGKTALALSMAARISGRDSDATSIAFFSLEMGRDQIVNRLLMQTSGIVGDVVRKGVLTPEQWEQMNPAMQSVANMHIYLDDTGALSIQELRLKAKKLVRRYGVQLIMVDYLQLLHDNALNRNATREQMVSTVSRGLKAIAKELNVPIVALSQVNRQSENTIDGRDLKLSHLRESGSIEQDADIVLMIQKPATADDDSERLIKISKNRNGRTGEILLHFRDGWFV